MGAPDGQVRGHRHPVLLGGRHGDHVRHPEPGGYPGHAGEDPGVDAPAPGRIPGGATAAARGGRGRARASPGRAHGRPRRARGRRARRDRGDRRGADRGGRRPQRPDRRVAGADRHLDLPYGRGRGAGPVRRDDDLPRDPRRVAATDPTTSPTDGGRRGRGGGVHGVAPADHPDRAPRASHPVRLALRPDPGRSHQDRRGAHVHRDGRRDLRGRALRRSHASDGERGRRGGAQRGQDGGVARPRRRPHRASRNWSARSCRTSSASSASA